MRLYLLTMLAAIVITLGACKWNESDFKSRLKEMDELAARAGPATATEIKKKKAELEQAFGKLPKGGGREDAVDKLGDRAYAAVERAEELIESAAKEKVAVKASAEKKELAKRSALFVGVWKSRQMRLVIQADGKASYEREKGASWRKVTGTFSDLSRQSFKIRVLGVGTTFKIDAPPSEKDGVWSMTIDGVKLYRIKIPGEKYVYGVKLCSKVVEGFCLGRREGYRNDESFHLIYDTKKLPKAGTVTSLRWIAEKTKEHPPEKLLLDVKGTVAYADKEPEDYTTGGFIGPPKGGRHATGTMRAEIRVGGELVAKKSFKVTGADQ